MVIIIAAILMLHGLGLHGWGRAPLMTKSQPIISHLPTVMTMLAFLLFLLLLLQSCMGVLHEGKKV